jgi:hypothetical protein
MGKETEAFIESKLHEVDFGKDANWPKNLVLVTTDDVIELMYQMMPYTLSMEEKWKAELRDGVIAKPDDQEHNE